MRITAIRTFFIIFVSLTIVQHFCAQIVLAQRPTIKVMTYNIRNFDDYSLSKSGAIRDTVQYIKDHDISVAAFQESNNSNGDKWSAILREKGMDGWQVYGAGHLLFISKYPLVIK